MDRPGGAELWRHWLANCWKEAAVCGFWLIRSEHWSLKSRKVLEQRPLHVAGSSWAQAFAVGQHTSCTCSMSSGPHCAAEVDRTAADARARAKDRIASARAGARPGSRARRPLAWARALRPRFFGLLPAAK